VPWQRALCPTNNVHATAIFPLSAERAAQFQHAMAADSSKRRLLARYHFS